MSEPREDESRDPLNDPLVEEIRETRRKLWAEAGGDVRRYIEQMRERLRKQELQQPPSDRARRSA